MISHFKTGQVFAAAGLTTGLLCTAAVISGCGPVHSSGARPAKTVTVTVQPSVPAGSPSVVASPPASPSPVASTSAPPAPPAPVPAGPPPCATRDLGAKVGQSQGAAGSVYTDLVFTNISGSTCTLYGYPGVSLAGGTPVTQLGAGATENPATPREVVTLVPGQEGFALLRIVQAGDFSPSGCGPAPSTYLQIFPPNQTTPIYLAYTSTACTKSVNQLTVDVVKPGTGAQ